MSRPSAKKPRRTAPERPVALEADYSRGLFSDVDRALSRWLLAHGQSVDKSPWKKTERTEIDWLPE